MVNKYFSKLFCFILVAVLSIILTKNVSAQTLSVGTTTVEVYAETLGNVQVTFEVIPELRIQINPPFNNLSTISSIEVRNLGSSVPIKTYGPFTTTNNGQFNTPFIFDGLTPGLYDVVIKGYSHLKKKITYFLVTSPPVNTLDFGTILCGDIHTNSTFPEGDNYVDSSDMNYLVTQWGVADSSVSDNKADVDEDQYVDSSDYTKVLRNYGKLGE